MATIKDSIFLSTASASIDLDSEPRPRRRGDRLRSCWRILEIRLQQLIGVVSPGRNELLTQRLEDDAGGDRVSDEVRHEKFENLKPNILRRKNQSKPDAAATQKRAIAQKGNQILVSGFGIGGVTLLKSRVFETIAYE
jgi:hypothetical protein